MHKIKNHTNSPHHIQLADGSKGRLPARGEGEFDVDPKMLPFYQRCGFLKLESVVPPMLYASDKLPALIPLTDDDAHNVQLGDVVRHAFEASNLTADEWNALPEDQREARLLGSITQMKADLATSSEGIEGLPDRDADSDTNTGESTGEGTAPDDKDALIAELAALGIKKDRRASVEALQAALKNVQEKKA
ncbi:hypothetical protein [Xanthomonas sp. BRIP62411]|uniref:hypothetical protein n=1 Tax=Xanthomonas sp. BRIP62411 TaxID=2182389 RepID=UPI000F8D6EF8|nr:hypothetical protein [Xanthomonas sp. BRIP62411]